MLERSLPRGGHEDTWKVDVLIDDLHIPQEVMDKTFRELSGGWQRLILIAAAKLCEPDIVILDEPTNHLDIENINKLERWLADAILLPMLIVSHDREFLDRTPHDDLLATRRRARFSGAIAVARRTAAPCASAARRHLGDKEITRLERSQPATKLEVLNSKFHKKRRATENGSAYRGFGRLSRGRKRAERRCHRRQGGAASAESGRETPDNIRTNSIDRLSGAPPVSVSRSWDLTGAASRHGVLADAYDPLQEHYDGRAPVRSQSGNQILFRPADGRPATESHCSDYIGDVKA
jgi:ATPase subunit of ABC transporter with duplicated ATPase domains